MTVQTALASAAELSNWLHSYVHGRKISSEDRVKVALAGALLDQVHEHHQAIHELLRSSLAGSAFSLFRPTFETYVRGVWLLRCASEEEVKKFTKDRIDKCLGEMIAEIEARPDYDVGVLSKVKKDAWSAMCSYTHGGYLQALHRITSGQITPRMRRSR